MGILLKENVTFGKASYDVLITKDNKSVFLLFGGNGDLYINARGAKSGDGTFAFYLNKNDDAYDFFAKLIDDIKKCNVFENNLILNKRLRRDPVFEKIYDGKTITLYSDSACDDNANSLFIFEENGAICLKFVRNVDDSIRGMGIRISNSGSKYSPFNTCFMRMFHSFQNYDKTIKTKR